MTTSNLFFVLFNSLVHFCVAHKHLLVHWVMSDLGVAASVRASCARLRADYTISTVDAVFSMIIILLFVGAYILLKRCERWIERERDENTRELEELLQD